MILMVDHHDSFTYNIVHYLEQLNIEVVTKTIDELDVQTIRTLAPSHIILSPGPGHPDDATLAHAIIDNFAGIIPILGVCLGFQVIMSHYGTLIYELSPVHGHQVDVYHDNTDIFKGLSNPTQVARYHSLGSNTVKSPLIMTAWSEEKIVMGIRHETLNISGVQFHPESILTTEGMTLLKRFIEKGVCYES